MNKSLKYVILKKYRHVWKDVENEKIINYLVTFMKINGQGFFDLNKKFNNP